MTRDAIHPGFVVGWCREVLGGEVGEVLFTAGWLSQVIGLRLADRRRVVVKVRPWSDRLTACAAVHLHLFESGFPCPEPLADVSRVGDWAVSAEDLVDQQSPLPATAAPRSSLPAWRISLDSLRSLLTWIRWPRRRPGPTGTATDGCISGRTLTTGPST